MVIQERKETVLNLLKDAERELVLGCDLKASEMIWGAVSHAIAAVAEQRGWPLEDFSFRAIVNAGERISEELDDAGFSAAELIYDHAAIDFLEEYELEPLYKDVRRFVNKMLVLAE